MDRGGAQSMIQGTVCASYEHVVQLCDSLMEAVGRYHMEVGGCPVWGWRWCHLHVHSHSSNLQETHTHTYSHKQQISAHL